jgi:four helix bundle protein
MSEVIFDHERLDVYRLAIEYVASSYRIAKSLNSVDRHVRDQWLRAAQSIPLNIAEGNGKQSLKDKRRFFEIARGSALECAAIHDVLQSIDAVDVATNQIGKSDLKRIVSMLTRLIQRSETVSEESVEYEYHPPKRTEYEYEYEHNTNRELRRSSGMNVSEWCCAVSSYSVHAGMQ